jgi:drug/metabolite transporter (DMT)-like permease
MNNNNNTRLRSIISFMILILTTISYFIGSSSSSITSSTSSSSSSSSLFAFAFAFAYTKIPNSLIDERRSQNNRRPFTTPQPNQNNKNDDNTIASLHRSSSTSLLLSTKQESSLTNTNDDENDNDETKETANNANVINQSRLLLGFVALLYGTLNVSLRFVYDIPNCIPPTAAALSASRGWIAFICFLPPLLLNNINMKKKKKKKNMENKSTTEMEKIIDDSNSKSSSIKLLLQSGIELSIWNFLAQGLLNIGLLNTGSARASFLTQCSILFTPIISTFIGKQYISKQIWFSCFIALIGLIILTIGGSTSAVGAAGAAASSAFSFSLSQGDLFVLGGALSWSIYLFRISIIGPKHQNNEIQLQGLKTGFVAILYSIWWFISSIIKGTGPSTGAGVGSLFTSLSSSLSSLSSLFTSLPSWMTTSYIVWIALFFSAIGPGTIADVSCYCCFLDVFYLFTLLS